MFETWFFYHEFYCIFVGSNSVVFRIYTFEITLEYHQLF